MADYKRRKKFHFNPYELVFAILLGLYAAAMIFLFVWAILQSLKTRSGFSKDPIGLPTAETFRFENYLDAFKAVRTQATIGGVKYYIYFPEMFFNSLIYAVGTAFAATITPCLVAYITAKYNNKFNKVVYGIVIFAMVTPIVGSLPSQIQMAKALHLYDSQLGLMIMAATFLGTYYLVFYASFKGLSWEYAESAFIDGANHYQVLFKIMLPLVRSTFLVIFLLNFIARWNDYQTPWMFLPNVPTAAVGVQTFTGGGEIQYNGIPIKLASNVLLMLPVVILFFIFKNKLVGNLTVGGIKG